MTAQMKRLSYLSIAKSLEEALLDSMDALDCMVDAYRVANDSFTHRQDDVDPTTICVGLQAQALGVLVLCNWLEAISSVTNTRFALVAAEEESKARRTMDALGIVIPTNMVV